MATGGREALSGAGWRLAEMFILMTDADDKPENPAIRRVVATNDG